MRNLETFKTPERNSLHQWWKVTNPFRTCINAATIHVGGYIPSLKVKRGLFRLLGMNIGKDVSIGVMSKFGIFFPELITLDDNCVIGYNATILEHEFNVTEWRKGPTRIGKNVLIGANSMVLAGITVGDGSIVAAGSVVTKNIPPGVMAGGVPAKIIKILE